MPAAKGNCVDRLPSFWRKLYRDCFLVKRSYAKYYCIMSYKFPSWAWDFSCRRAPKFCQINCLTNTLSYNSSCIFWFLSCNYQREAIQKGPFSDSDLFIPSQNAAYKKYKRKK